MGEDEYLLVISCFMIYTQHLARRYGKSKVGIGLGPRSKNPKINAQ
jgi:hypothetical protein